MGAAVSAETSHTLVLSDTDNVQPCPHNQCVVLRMPPDVLEQISMMHLNSVPTTENARFFAAVSLSQINQQTRKILLSRGAYWSDIVFDMYLNPRTAAIALERSAGAPLRVEISDSSWSYGAKAHPNAQSAVREFFSTVDYVERIQDLVMNWLPDDDLDGPGGVQKTESTYFIGIPKALRSLEIREVELPVAADWIGSSTRHIHYEPQDPEERPDQLESMLPNAPNLQSLRIGIVSDSMMQNTGRLGYPPSQVHGALAELLVAGVFIEPEFVELVRRYYPRTFRDAQFIAIDSSEDKDFAAQSIPHLGIQDITERCSVSIYIRMCTALYHSSGRKRVFTVRDNIVHGSAEPEAKAVWRHLISCAESLHMRNLYAWELSQHLEGIRAAPSLCATLREIHLDVLKPVLCDRPLFSEEWRAGRSTTSSQITPRIALPSLRTLTLRPTHRDYFHDDEVVLWSVFAEKQKLSMDKLLHVGKNWAWILDQFELSQSEREKVQWASDVGKDDRRVLQNLVDQAWQDMHSGDVFFGPGPPGFCL